MLDKIVEVCVGLAFVPVLAYALIVQRQYSALQAKTYRLTVLATRTALFLPLYSIIMIICMVYPQSASALSCIITIVEGYSFYCFFSLMVTNLGGPAATITLMYQTQRALFCSCCCSADSAIFYKSATWAMFHMFITRTILSIFIAIATYSNTSGGELAALVLEVTSAVILGRGIVALVNICKFILFLLLYLFLISLILMADENLFEHSTNLYGLVKLILLKVTVGVIVLQGLIAAFIYSSGASPYSDDDELSQEEKTQRAYCKLLSVLTFTVFNKNNVFYRCPRYTTVCSVVYCILLRIWMESDYPKYCAEGSSASKCCAL